MGPSLRLLAKAAHMYYVSQLRQEAIGQYLNLSRSTISRMLAEAGDRALVEITISYPAETNLHIERQLERQFSLHEVLKKAHRRNLRSLLCRRWREPRCRVRATRHRSVTR